ncbi:uncharacterized protein Dmul_22860 [Desulfococcus multivorans]|nr:uncharacterized protein Dmul_22860 [Desulfococcus multivorans]
MAWLPPFIHIGFIRRRSQNDIMAKAWHKSESISITPGINQGRGAKLFSLAVLRILKVIVVTRNTLF